MSQLTYLKIKIQSLALEAKLIRQEEQRCKRSKWFRREWEQGQPYGKTRSTYFGLRLHRHEVVRTENRSANLAYGFLRGRRYRQLEAKCHLPPDWKRVATIVSKFTLTSEKVRYDEIKRWAEGN